MAYSINVIVIRFNILYYILIFESLSLCLSCMEFEITYYTFNTNSQF